MKSVHNAGAIMLLWCVTLHAQMGIGKVASQGKPGVTIGQQADQQATTPHIGGTTGTISTETAHVGGPSDQPPPVQPSKFKQLFASPSIQQGGQRRNKARELLRQPHVITWYTKEHREQLFTQVLALYRQALNLFVQGYREFGISIDASKPFNYVIITIYDIINLYLDELKRQANALNVTQAKNEDITGQVQAFKNFLGIADRDIVGLQPLIEKQGDIVAAAYKKQRDLMVFSTYSLLLINLSGATKQPVAGPQALPDSYYQQRIAEGLDYFNQAQTAWNVDLSVPGYKSAEEARRVVYRSLASLYALRAFNALKTMNGTQGESVLTQHVNLAIDQLSEALKQYQAIQDDDEAKKLYGAYQRFHDQLALGLQLRNTAAQQKDMQQKVSLLHQAHDALLAGGAEVFAGITDQSAFVLEADNALLAAKAQSASVQLPVSTTYADNLSSALQLLTRNRTQLNTVQIGYGKAAQAYQNALNAFDMPNTSALQQKATLIPLVQSVTDSTAQALQKLVDGLQYIQQETSLDQQIAALSQAKPLLDQAVAIALDVDTRVSQHKSMVDLLPWYQPFAVYVQQCIVYAIKGISVVVAQQQVTTQQQTLMYDYYMLAFAYRNAIPASLAQEIQTQLTSYDLLGKAQSAYQAALAAIDWKVTDNTTSVADTLWQQAIMTAFAAYAAWKVTGQFKGAEEAYITCVQTAATRYAKNMPPDQGPVRAAVQLYRAYAVYSEQGLSEDAQKVTNTINGWLTSFFAKAQAPLSATISGALKDRLDALNALSAWERLANAAVQEQNKVIQDMGQITTKALGAVLIVSQTGNQKVYSSPLVNMSVSLPLSLDMAMADVYVQQAQTAATHQEARNAYESAITFYTKAGETAKAAALQQRYAQEKLLADAESYDQLVLPFGPESNVFKGITVFARYFITVYLERIPSTLALPQPLVDFLTKLSHASTEQQKALQESAEGQQLLQSTLPVLAQAVYLYNALAVNNLLDAIAGVDLYGLIVQGKDSDDQTVQGFVRDARSFGVKLAAALQGTTLDGQKVVTKLALFAKPDHASLIYGNRPVTAIPEVTSAHPWDPTALAYYTQSADKYKTAGDTTQSAAAQKKMSLTFLSHAYGIRQRARFMQGLELREQLIAVLASDTDELNLLRTTKAQLATNVTVLSDTLVNAIQLVRLYYGAAIGDVADAGISGDDYSAFSALLYEESADFLRGWLRGDPLSDAYQASIMPINQSYLLAQGAYQQAQQQSKVRDVGIKIASLFELVGDACNKVGKFLQAIGYYNAAEKAYVNATPNDQKSLIRVRYKAVAAQFKGATNYFSTYYAQRTKKTEDVRDTLLDALIFYSSISDVAQAMYSDVPTATTQQQAAARINDYLTTNKALFGADAQSMGTPGALARLMLNDEQLNKISAEQMVSFINGGFDYSAAPLLKDTMAPDEYTIAVTTIIQWASAITGALSARYIHDFLPDASPEDQLSDLLSAMKAETHQIFAPSDQYIGSFGSSVGDDESS